MHKKKSQPLQVFSNWEKYIYLSDSNALNTFRASCIHGCSLMENDVRRIKLTLNKIQDQEVERILGASTLYFQSLPAVAPYLDSLIELIWDRPQDKSIIVMVNQQRCSSLRLRAKFFASCKIREYILIPGPMPIF